MLLMGTEVWRLRSTSRLLETRAFDFELAGKSNETVRHSFDFDLVIFCEYQEGVCGGYGLSMCRSRVWIWPGLGVRRI